MLWLGLGFKYLFLLLQMWLDFFSQGFVKNKKISSGITFTNVETQARTGVTGSTPPSLQVMNMQSKPHVTCFVEMSTWYGADDTYKHEQIYGLQKRIG